MPALLDRCHVSHFKNKPLISNGWQTSTRSRTNDECVTRKQDHASVAPSDVVQKGLATVFKPTDAFGERPIDAPERLSLARSPIHETLGDRC
jgi:hypothetical protein